MWCTVIGPLKITIENPSIIWTPTFASGLKHLRFAVHLVGYVGPTNMPPHSIEDADRGNSPRLLSRPKSLLLLPKTRDCTCDCDLASPRFTQGGLWSARWLDQTKRWDHTQFKLGFICSLRIPCLCVIADSSNLHLNIAYPNQFCKMNNLAVEWFFVCRAFEIAQEWYVQFRWDGIPFFPSFPNPKKNVLGKQAFLLTCLLTWDRYWIYSSFVHLYFVDRVDHGTQQDWSELKEITYYRSTAAKSDKTHTCK